MGLWARSMFEAHLLQYFRCLSQAALFFKATFLRLNLQNLVSLFLSHGERERER